MILAVAAAAATVGVIRTKASKLRSRLRALKTALKNNAPRVPFDTRRVPLFGLMRFPAQESYPVPSKI